jgi:hypothetical protein
MVSGRGIEVDPNKGKVIQSMSSPKIEKKVWWFLQKLNYIAWFISQLITTCESIFQQSRKKNHGT